MTREELDERIEKAMLEMNRLVRARRGSDLETHSESWNEELAILKQLIRDCIEAVTPDWEHGAYYTKHPVLWAPTAPEGNKQHYDAGFNQAAEVVRANTKELLG